MSKGKFSVQVRSSKGTNWTTRRGARRLVERGLADAFSECVVVMKEQHPEYRAEAPAPTVRPHSPTLRVIERDLPDDYRNRELGLPNFCGFQKPSRTGRWVD